MKSFGDDSVLSLFTRCGRCNKRFSPGEQKQLASNGRFEEYAVCYGCKPEEIKPKEKAAPADPNKCAHCGTDFTSSMARYELTRGTEPFDTFNICYSCLNGR